jgi:23S rRNA G2069 N7-methylase RlmK/C1962 C5-methylase RlmI
MFDGIAAAALARTRRGAAAVLAVTSQPEDHPYPLACPELRYLKFTLLALD